MTTTKLSDILFKIEADEGKVLVASDHSAVYSTIAYAPTSNPTNIEEVTIEEAAAIQAIIDAKL